MSSDHRHGRIEDPVTNADPELSPDAIPPVPPPPTIPATAGVAELRQLLIDFSTSIYKSVAAIPGAIRSLDSRSGLLRRLTRIGLVVLVFDIALTLIIGWVTHSTQVTQNQLKATEAQLQAVVGKLDHVVHGNCYVLGIAVPNYHKGDSPQRLSYPAGPAAYDQLYIGMQAWSDELGCGIPHVVPGT